jgi:flagellar biosynthesis protein FlhG
VADLLAGRESIHAALQRGPAGLQIVPGATPAQTSREFLPSLQERFLCSLRELGPYADFVVLDVGAGLNRTVRRFWCFADTLLVVATPDASSLMASYAAIKLLAPGGEASDMRAVVNLASPADACATHSRLARACQRFLGLELPLAGHVPRDHGFALAARGRSPLSLAVLQSPAVPALDELAEELAADPAAHLGDRQPALGIH